MQNRQQRHPERAQRVEGSMKSMLSAALFSWMNVKKGSFLNKLIFIPTLVVLTKWQIRSTHLRNILACFRLSSLSVLIKQAKSEASKAIMASKERAKVILTFLIAPHSVIYFSSPLLRKNHKF